MDAVLQESLYGDDVRYVTQHFKELQGLRMVPFWTSVIMLSALEYAHPLPRWHAVCLFLALIVLALLLAGFIERWYRREYGFVAKREERPPEPLSVLRPNQIIRKQKSRWFMPLLVVVFALMFYPLFLHSYRNYSDFGLLTIIFFVLPKMSLASTGSNLLRGRQVLAIAGSGALITLQIVYDLGRLNTWVFVGTSAFVLLVGSLYDHWLLKRLLGGSLMEAHHA